LIALISVESINAHSTECCWVEVKKRDGMHEIRYNYLPAGVPVQEWLLWAIMGGVLCYGRLHSDECRICVRGVCKNIILITFLKLFAGQRRKRVVGRRKGEGMVNSYSNLGKL
jgi:hypothetical protein